MPSLRIATAAANLTPTKHPTRVGISLVMGANPSALISPQWMMAGWQLQFARLPPQQTLELEPSGGTHYVKVVLGSLADPVRRVYPKVGELINTRVANNSIRAGDEGALIALFRETALVPKVLDSVNQLTIAGPLADALRWTTFEERFSKFTPFFNGADAHLVPGFHLLDQNGAEIAYIYFWMAGKGVDLSTHNHGNTPSDLAPAFAEVHQVLNNGTGQGGMYRTEAPGAPHRSRLPMQRGEEHGPFFAIDAKTAKAKLRDNGAVEYPWHGWEAGNDNRPGQSYDLVCAYEITAPYANV